MPMCFVPQGYPELQTATWPEHHKPTALAGWKVVEACAARFPEGNTAFAQLPWGKTLAQVIAQHIIWLHYDAHAGVYERLEPLQNGSPECRAFRQPRLGAFQSLGDHAYMLPHSVMGGDNGQLELALTELALRLGCWVVAGALIHELAHLAGAVGDRIDAADDIITKFGMRTWPKGPYWTCVSHTPLGEERGGG